MPRLLSLGTSLCCRRLLGLQLLRVLLLQALPRGGDGGILGLQQCMCTCLQCAPMCKFTRLFCINRNQHNLYLSKRPFTVAVDQTAALLPLILASLGSSPAAKYSP